MFLQIFSSGSVWNWAFLGRGEKYSDGGIFIDASVTRIRQRMYLMGMQMSDVLWMLYTHKHSDHYRPPNVNMFAKEGILQHFPFHDADSLCQGRTARNEEIFSCDMSEIEDVWDDGSPDTLLSLEFSLVHDAECYGCAFDLWDSLCLTWITDTSVITPETEEYIRDSSVVCIDCDYDEYMLQTKLYPPYLHDDYGLPLEGVISGSSKYPDERLDRIVREGHLSVQQVMEIIYDHADIVDTWVLLHNSRTFNHPQVMCHCIEKKGFGNCEVFIAEVESIGILI